MKKINHLLKGFGAAAMLSASALLPLQVQAEEPLKVGFVYVTPTGEAGCTYTHDHGRNHIEEKFGDKVKTTFVENVAEGADA